MTEARCDGTKEMAEARPDAEADQQVTLIRGKAFRAARVSVQEQAIKDGDQAEGLMS